MTVLADAQGTLVRIARRVAEAAPVAWRYDPLFRGASVGTAVTLALLLLRFAGPHNPDLDAPTLHYDPATRQTWTGPRNATTPPQPPAQPPAPVPDVPKITPGQPLGAVTVIPAPTADRFGTFTPGKHP